MSAWCWGCFSVRYPLMDGRPGVVPRLRESLRQVFHPSNDCLSNSVLFNCSVEALDRFSLLLFLPMSFLPKAVYILGAVSFLTDLSSEMIYPLLPAFLTLVLGAGAVQMGIIEGVAESTAAFLKILSGLWTDRLQKRKPFLLFGYSISGLARPLIGLANLWPFVLILRFCDRVGKGLRTSPRDALIADVVEPAKRGRAYGIHRAMDHAGAVAGPLVAIALMQGWRLDLRTVFYLAAIPGVFVVVLLALGLREPAEKREIAKSVPISFKVVGQMPRNFKVFMSAVFVFTLGNSTDAFFLLRLSENGVAPEGVAFLWSMHHVVKMLSTYWGGRLADRIGRLKPLIAGWVFYAVIYLAFGLSSGIGMMVILFLAYGIYFGLTEPTEKAIVGDLAPVDLRGTAFGIYHGVIGLAAFPASLIFGLIWKSFGAPAAFMTGAALALMASFVIGLGLKEKCIRA